MTISECMYNYLFYTRSAIVRTSKYLVTSTKVKFPLNELTFNFNIIFHVNLISFIMSMCPNQLLYLCQLLLLVKVFPIQFGYVSDFIRMVTFFVLIWFGTRCPPWSRPPAGCRVLEVVGSFCTRSGHDAEWHVAVTGRPIWSHLHLIQI